MTSRALTAARWWHASSVHALRAGDGGGTMFLMSTDAANGLKLQEIDTKLKRVLDEQAYIKAQVATMCQSHDEEDGIGGIKETLDQIWEKLDNDDDEDRIGGIKETLDQIWEKLDNDDEEDRIGGIKETLDQIWGKLDNDDDDDRIGGIKETLDEIWKKLDSDDDANKQQDKLREEITQVSVTLSKEIEQLKTSYVALSQHVATLDNALVEARKNEQREREAVDKALVRFAAGLGLVTLSVCSLAAFDWTSRLF